MKTILLFFGTFIACGLGFAEKTGLPDASRQAKLIIGEGEVTDYPVRYRAIQKLSKSIPSIDASYYVSFLSKLPKNEKIGVNLQHEYNSNSHLTVALAAQPHPRLGQYNKLIQLSFNSLLPHLAIKPCICYGPN